ncbi:MAG: hypothetical protein FD123_2703 [Bacteroidetes bacterium]|nr:MAG: hypothetical protein FD123_2703 [Bacteroidota bacterium]
MSFSFSRIKILAFTAGIFFSFLLPAQYSGKELKSINKSKRYYNDGKYEKAVSSLEHILDAHETDGELWNLMVHYKAARYEAQKNKEMADLMNVLMAGINKGKSVSISMDNSLSTRYMGEYLSACKRATLCADKQYNASVILRNIYIDEPVDTGVSNEAKEKFGEAEKEFQAKNFAKAVNLYKQALDLDSSYYKAGLYLGDSYWNDNQPEQAVKYFKRSISQEPGMLEPRKYLTDAYASMKEYDLAYNECVNAILIHPDLSMFAKLSDICELKGKTFDRHWMARTFYTNDPKNEQGPIAELPWKYYREAKEKIAPYCNSGGMIDKSNSLTKEKYMESYCWEYMLTQYKTDDAKFVFARKMQKAGQLDCYVLLSMYHIGINDQFIHLAKTNPDKIRDYIKNYLVQ